MLLKVTIAGGCGKNSSSRDQTEARCAPSLNSIEYSARNPGAIISVTQNRSDFRTENKNNDFRLSINELSTSTFDSTLDPWNTAQVNGFNAQKLVKIKFVSTSRSTG